MWSSTVAKNESVKHPWRDKSNENRVLLADKAMVENVSNDFMAIYKPYVRAVSSCAHALPRRAPIACTFYSRETTLYLVGTAQDERGMQIR